MAGPDIPVSWRKAMIHVDKRNVLELSPNQDGPVSIIDISTGGTIHEDICAQRIFYRKKVVCS